MFIFVEIYFMIDSIVTPEAQSKLVELLEITKQMAALEKRLIELGVRIDTGFIESKLMEFTHELLMPSSGDADKGI